MRSASLLDLALGAIALEALLLPRTGFAWRANLAAGAAILGSARCVAAGGGAQRLVAPLLAVALIAHGADLRGRRRA